MPATVAELHLPAAQLDALRHILASRLPVGVKVQVFGSRATGIRLKPHSDLDLLIVGPDKLPLLLQGDFALVNVEAQHTCCPRQPGRRR